MSVIKKFCLCVQQGIIQIEFIHQTHPIRKIVIKNIVDELFRWDNPVVIEIVG